ncbi:P1 family peptidase [soil metagenome]
MTDSRPRPRECGLHLGKLPIGPHNAITDVDGVLVGHVTIMEGTGRITPGAGPFRTGVTVIRPHPGDVFREKLPAATYVANGFGKSVGLAQVDELGVIESPIALTGTLNVGLVADGLVEHAISTNPDIGIGTTSFNPVVGECNDGQLSDLQGRPVTREHVLSAIEGAVSGPVEEGVVGAGTGMVLHGFKGGIGTASRKLSGELGSYTVGVLVLGNFGRRDQLVIAGVPVGEHLLDWEPAPDVPESGSIMIVVATDAPMLDRPLRRMARRVPLGLARTGSIIGHGSGDFVIAFSAAQRIPHYPEGNVLDLRQIVEHGRLIDGLFQAVVEATEEAVVSALFASTTVEGRDGNLRHGLPLDETLTLLDPAGRLRHEQ